MAFKRVDTLLEQITRVLRGLEKVGFNRDDVLDALSEAQRAVCREGHALKGQSVLTTLAGVASYPVRGLIAVTAMVPPARWSEPLTVVENDRIWADHLSRTHSADFPLFVRPYGETVQFLPPPAISGERVAIEYAHYPAVGRLEPGTDPEVSPLWEPALKVGTLSELLGGDYTIAFARAINLAATRHANVAKGVPVRDHWSRTLGF